MRLTQLAMLLSALLLATTAPASFALGQTTEDTPTQQSPAPTQTKPSSGAPAEAVGSRSETPNAIGVSPLSDSSLSPRPLRAESNADKMPELSPWSMFMEADIVVKSVMVGLAFASLLTWSLLLGKSFELLLSKRRVYKALKRVQGARSLDEAYLSVGANRDIVSRFVREAHDEMRLSADVLHECGVANRVSTRFSETLKDEGRSIRRGMGLLATIGSTAPFVGLFGTVWGIMNSFIGISKAQSTNLAIVAPGIAEALLATAIGLIAAIPAVIFYNHFTRVTKSFLDDASCAGGFVGRLLSRDLDRLRYSRAPRAAAGE